MKVPHLLIAISFVCGLLPSLASAQAVLDKTTLDKPQNDARDLANSLVPGEQKYGKGERKAQVKATELKSKSINDSTFGGTLLNMGIDPAAPKLDESKLREAKSEEASTRLKQAEPKQKEPEPLLQLADPAAIGLSESGQSAAVADKGKAQPNASGDGQKKEEKAVETQKEKASANKTDGDH